MNQVQKDGKMFQKIYFRAKRGKDKGKVQIKLKRLDRSKKRNKHSRFQARRNKKIMY